MANPKTFFCLFFILVIGKRFYTFAHLVPHPLFFSPYYIHMLIAFFQNQDMKIEGESTETMEEDNLDLLLPTKKKKSKKVEFDEGSTLEKDDSKNKSINIQKQ